MSVAREWVSQSRPASPRLLFLFLSAPLALRGDWGRRDERRDAKPNRHPPIKRLEHSLEDQIYRILRKARIITNVASNSLFAVPSNQEYCYVETGGRGSAMDPEAAALNTLLTLMARGEVGAAVGGEQGPYYPRRRPVSQQGGPAAPAVHGARGPAAHAGNTCHLLPPVTCNLPRDERGILLKVSITVIPLHF